MIKVKTFYVIDLEKSVTQATADITNGLLDESGVITTFEPTEVKTLLGENTIYSDTGDVDVTIRADIGLYIGKKISSLAQTYYRE